MSWIFIFDCSTLDFVYPEPCPPTARRWTHWLQDLGCHTAAYESWVKKIEEIKQQLVEFRQCNNTAFEWKMQFTCFPILPGGAEAQVIWGGRVKHVLIAYFISNISAKKYKNPFTCVKVKVKQKVGRFLTHSLYCKLAVLPINFVNQCL